MAVAASGTVTLNTLLNAIDTLDLSVEKKSALSKSIQASFSSGVGLNQLDRVFADERTVAGSATDVLDLIGGGLLDILGATFAPARIKVLIVVNLGPNTVNLQRPAAATGVPIFLAAADAEPIHTGGFACKVWPSAAGIVVTATTGDIIEIVNTAAGNTTVQVIIGAASA